MNITLSKHAAEQAVKREITEEGMIAIVNGDAFRTVYPSKSDPEASVFTGFYGDKLWSVIVNDNTDVIITVRRAHKNEERNYYGETANRA